MAIYGAAMLALSPTARKTGEFFAARGRDGRDIGTGMLIGTVVISWIFAKSITNAANLAETYGFVGAVAYGGWYLSIPVAGVVLYRIRRSSGAQSVADFLRGKYGRAATGAFTIVILLRLFNEVWSNTAVVGSYFGVAGSLPYFASALVFSLITMTYSLRGGMRSSVITDALQLGFALFLLVFVLALIVPSSGSVALLTSGEWTLAGGVDLLLVALLQSFSYPFHDPVLTDRAFITSPKRMLRGYLIAGAIAFAFIVTFGLVGVHGHLAGIVAEQDAPLKVAAAFGVGTLAVMSVLMMVSAGSTLDSTLSAFSRIAAVDVANATHAPRAIRIGRWAMLIAIVLGSIPLFAGATIISATTVSGTMVLGLAPIFLLHAWRRPGPWAFHLSFWLGLAVGIAYAAQSLPSQIALGDGPYAGLLGANVYGTVLVFLGYAIGAWLDGRATRAAPTRDARSGPR